MSPPPHRNLRAQSRQRALSLTLARLNSRQTDESRRMSASPVSKTDPHSSSGTPEKEADGYTLPSQFTHRDSTPALPRSSLSKRGRSRRRRNDSSLSMR